MAILRPVARLVATLAVVGSMSLWWGATASADETGQIKFDVPGDGVGFVEDLPGPLLQFDRMWPGDTVSAVVSVQNDSADPAELALEAFDVEESENTCFEPETSSGDSTCGVDDGELGDWLVLSVSREGEELWSGGIEDLTERVVLGGQMPAGAEWRLVFSGTVPGLAGNDTMSDRVGFALRWSLKGEDGETQNEVLGTEGDASGGPSGGGLPFTGSTLGIPEVLLGFSLLALGVGLIRVAGSHTIA